MTQSLRSALASSLGQKVVVAVSGLALVGFLVVHLAGNLTLFAASDGSKFDAYARALAANPLVTVAEVVLAALFALHIAMALRVTWKNRAARPERYAVDASCGGRTLGSGSMIVTGSIVLVFLVVHLLDFRIASLLAGEYGPSLSSRVRVRLADPVGGAIYLVGCAAVGIHLSHAVRSAFQTLGASHPRVDAAVRRGGVALAVVLALGFAAFPIYFLACGRAAGPAP